MLPHNEKVYRSIIFPILISNFEKAPNPEFNEVHSKKMTPPVHNILITFFSLAYKICFSPFQLKQDLNGVFYIKQWLPHQMICSVGAIASIFYRVIEVSTELPSASLGWNPALYFKLFHRFLNSIFNLNIWIALWFRKRKFLDIIQFFQRNLNDTSILRSQKKLSLLVAIVGITNTTLVTIYFVLGTDILPQSRFDPKFLFKCFAAHSRSFSFCIEHLDCNDVPDFPLEELTILETIVALAFTLSRFLRKVMGISEELLVLVGPLTLWIAVKDFVRNVVECDASSTNENQSWQVIFKKYRDLNTLTDLVNSTYGPIMLSYTLTALFYFSINLDEFLTAEDTAVRFKFFIYYLLIVSTFTISAEIVHQIGKLAPWISKNLQETLLSEMSHRELTIILHEISANRIGISACGLFTVTYSVVAQMTGVIVTYFIITVQYRDQK